MTYEVACFGEPLIGFYKQENHQEKNISFEMIIGGDTSNVAMAVSKLGHTSSYITKLGNDFFAQYFKKAWQGAKVDTDNVLYDDEHSTGVYYALFDQEGNHKFAYKRKDSAAANYDIADAEKVVLDGIRVFHTSGITQAISRTALETSFYFLDKCKKENILISYDLNYRQPLWSSDYFRSIAWYTIEHYANIVTLNLEEMKILGFNDPENAARDIIKKGPEMVNIKLGSRGSMIARKNYFKYCGPFKVEVKDTVGAGDAYTAAIIVGYLEGVEIGEMQKFANAVAALVCSRTGSTNGQPTIHQVGEFMKTYTNK